jgi:hypothetical protein
VYCRSLIPSRGKEAEKMVKYIAWSFGLTGPLARRRSG